MYADRCLKSRRKCTKKAIFKLTPNIKCGVHAVGYKWNRFDLCIFCDATIIIVILISYPTFFAWEFTRKISIFMNEQKIECFLEGNCDKKKFEIKLWNLQQMSNRTPAVLSHPRQIGA